jgi:maltose alpha-D-glucosyltransferase/alpha-amylase
LLQQFVANQGDGWTYSLDYLRRHLEQHRTAPLSDALPVNVHEAYLTLIRVLATRTAELHRALAQPSNDPAFAPEPLSRDDLADCRQHTLETAAQALDLLQSGLESLPPEAQEPARAVLRQRSPLLARIDAAAAGPPMGPKIRIHGDYHLGRVLITRNDFVIVDFEGESDESAAQRRRKHSPLRDVAAMLRSFNYVRHSALRGVTHDDVEMKKLAPLASAWEVEVRDAFLSAYADAAGPLSMGSLRPGEGLLGLFEWERMLKELQEELRWRPQWVTVPLEGILDTGGSNAKL